MLGSRQLKHLFLVGGIFSMSFHGIGANVIMLDVFLVLLVLFTSAVDCKYCWHRSKFGKSKHFYCGAFEYCCGDKCCENFDEFYKLWYFWLCVMVVVLTSCVALYWLKRRFQIQQLFEQSSEVLPQRTSRRRRRHNRRYRQLSGDAAGVPTGSVVLPPPYSGDNTGCPHPGPPPYCLGSGSSISTLPPGPPAYAQIEKLPPPAYSSIAAHEVITIVDPDTLILEDKKASPDTEELPR